MILFLIFFAFSLWAFDSIAVAIYARRYGALSQLPNWSLVPGRMSYWLLVEEKS